MLFRSELGLSEDNAYLFMSCHDVFDRVFLPVMKYVGDDLTKKHFAFLTTNKEKKIYQAYIEINSFKTLAQSNPQMFGHLFLSTHYSKYTNRFSELAY